MIARCAGVGGRHRGGQLRPRSNDLLAVRYAAAATAPRDCLLCDDGLAIDLHSDEGRAHSIAVGRTAQVQAGALWADLDRETQAFGLATTGGTVSEYGRVWSHAGWRARLADGQVRASTYDNLLSVDLVTADGAFLTKRVRPSIRILFWALRGGGGNFGVATSFEFKLHDVGPTVLGGLVIYPLSEARSVLRFYRDFCISLPTLARRGIAPF